VSRLRAIINRKFPNVVDDLWSQQSFAIRLDMMLGPAVFCRHALLLNLSVINLTCFPVQIFGDDEIARLVGTLRNRYLNVIYGNLCRLAGY